jgi:ubiquinone/menaquinone biosynthesis C-methylase UbiE
MKIKMTSNISLKTVEDFGNEWSVYSHSDIGNDFLIKQFNRYFCIFPWDTLKEDAKGFDMGCGTGRWAKFVAQRVGKLYCFDASEKAVGVARRNLRDHANCSIVQATFDKIPLEDNSMDFGYSLGVLHHIPDTFQGIASCVKKLKPGAPFLAYIYYALDNRSFLFKLIWKITDALRKKIASKPFEHKLFFSRLIALCVYLPLSRTAFCLEKFGINSDAIPLSYYKNEPFYTMKTDALDRFGTRLEKRFNKKEITEMFAQAGLKNIMFSDGMPYWCAIGYKV